MSNRNRGGRSRWDNNNDNNQRHENSHYSDSKRQYKEDDDYHSKRHRGQHRSDDRGYHRDRDRRRSRDDYDRRRSGENDYYGGSGYNADRDCDGLQKHPNNKKKKWPPLFETSGGLYVFDPRSGFFFESQSNFYFDPKSKLYFGNDEQAYFQHVPGGDPPFVKVEEQTSSSPSKNDNGDDAAVNANENENKKSKATPTIAFGAITKLKTLTNVTVTASKSNGNANENSSVSDEIAIQQARAIVADVAGSNANGVAGAVISKRDADNLSKWTERKAEKKIQSTGSKIHADNKEGAKVKVKLQLNNKPPMMMAMTKSGKPICLVCKRKFESMEKLKQHEELSALHKSNLVKIQNENPGFSYKDRAKERRFLYGDAGAMSASTKQEDEQMAQLQGNCPNLNKARTVLQTEVVRPEDSVGSANIGHQMLQKLGWKKGETLGRNKKDGEMNVKLKQDWETIETLASTTSTNTYGGGKNKYSRYHQ